MKKGVSYPTPWASNILLKFHNYSALGLYLRNVQCLHPEMSGIEYSGHEFCVAFHGLDNINKVISDAP